MRLKKLYILLLGFCLCFIGTSALAAPKLAPAPERVLYISGEISAIDGNQITVQQVNDPGEKDGGQTIAFNLPKGQKAYQAVNGDSISLKKLLVGDAVTVFYSPMMTRSIPPQSKCYALVTGHYNDIEGDFVEVAAVNFIEQEKYMEVTTTNDLIISVNRKAFKHFKYLAKGDKLIVWYNTVTMSLPPKTNAIRVVRLEEPKLKK